MCQGRPPRIGRGLLRCRRPRHPLLGDPSIGGGADSAVFPLILLCPLHRSPPETKGRTIGRSRRGHRLAAAPRLKDAAGLPPVDGPEHHTCLLYFAGARSPQGNFCPLRTIPPTPPYNSSASVPNTRAGPETGWWVGPPSGGPQRRRPATGGGASRTKASQTEAFRGPSRRAHPSNPNSKPPPPRLPPAPTGSGPWAGGCVDCLFPCHRRNPP